MQPPAFLGGDSHAYDLRMLASADRVELLAAHRSVALMDQLAAVDLLDPAAFPVGALTELTTLDPGQITALKVSSLVTGLCFDCCISRARPVCTEG